MASNLEQKMLAQIKSAGLLKPDAEYPTGYGKTRFDFAWDFLKLAVEVEGGTWTNGRHSRGAGMTKDCNKYNYATISGWMVIRVTSDMIDSGSAIQAVINAYDAATKKTTDNYIIDFK